MLQAAQFSLIVRIGAFGSQSEDSDVMTTEYGVTIDPLIGKLCDATRKLRDPIHGQSEIPGGVYACSVQCVFFCWNGAGCQGGCQSCCEAGCTNGCQQGCDRGQR